MLLICFYNVQYDKSAFFLLNTKGLMAFSFLLMRYNTIALHSAYRKKKSAVFQSTWIVFHFYFFFGLGGKKKSLDTRATDLSKQFSSFAVLSLRLIFIRVSLSSTSPPSQWDRAASPLPYTAAAVNQQAIIALWWQEGCRSENSSCLWCEVLSRNLLAARSSSNTGSMLKDPPHPHPPPFERLRSYRRWMYSENGKKK